MEKNQALLMIDEMLEILDLADKGSGSEARDYLSSASADLVNSNVKVTSDLSRLQTQWKEAELGDNDELAAFLNQVGKVVEVEEDDDTLKIRWLNYDTCWVPASACSTTNEDVSVPGLANSWLAPEAEAQEAKEERFESVEDDGVKAGNLVQVTNSVSVLQDRWKEAELGPIDDLKPYCGVVGKITEIEEDDDTVQLRWENLDTFWIPVKACSKTTATKETTPLIANSWMGK